VAEVSASASAIGRRLHGGRDSIRAPRTTGWLGLAALVSACMKTTVEINDALLERARCRAIETGQSLGAVVEDGLRQLLAKPRPAGRYRMRDLSYGDPDGPDPLKQYSWNQIRDLMSEGR